jgi:hypothetical protein
MSERPKEMRCKRIGTAYEGSNPSPPIALACLIESWRLSFAAADHPSSDEYENAAS